MKIDLPNQGLNTLHKEASVMFAEATAHSTHSKSASILGGDVQIAFPKIYDPSRRGGNVNGYGNIGGGLNILDFDENDETRRALLLACRNIAKTHPIMRACIEVYSRYPISGISLKHSDKEYERFYTELFLEDLDFENFLTSLGQVYWTDGNAFVFGNWSDSLGLWVGEDILEPLNMVVKRIPFAGEDLVYMRPTEDLKSIIRGSEPEAISFRNKFPDMASQIESGKDILMSSDRLTFIANKDRPSELWGTPVTLRAWNTLRLEDRMNAAMQATADRMYAPLIMFTVGGKLPDGNEFIPSAAMLNAFRNNLDAALAADFRAIVTHSGVTSQEVIRGDSMSKFKQDMDMFDDRIFMAWGLTSSILKPQNGTYATTALEFELAAQMLASYQKVLVSVYNKQAAFVAEAHEHYEYEKKGDSLTPVYEKKEVWDPEAMDGEGAWVVKDVPKLSYPEMKFDVINFRDEQKEREFRMSLRNAGIPIADEDVAIGIDLDLKDSEEKYNREQIKHKTDEARRESAIFQATVEQGITVPPDTKKYMELGIPPFKYQRLVEKFQSEDGVGDDPFGKTDSEELEDSVMESLEGDTFSYDGESDIGVRSRPEISDEMRSDMPKQ